MRGRMFENDFIGLPGVESEQQKMFAFVPMFALFTIRVRSWGKTVVFCEYGEA